jgi:Mrp family chromosome partitioning ATPase
LSKNFELLQQVEKDRELFKTGVPSNPPAPVAESRRDEPARTTSGSGGRRMKLDAGTKEAATKLVQRIFFLGKQETTRAVVFAAVETGDGATTVCACAAEALAEQSRGSVCVVDANFRDPGLHRRFGLENRRGLAEALVQTGSIRSFSEQISGSNLWVLTAGACGADGNQLLNTEAMRARVVELCAEFDHVLFDSAALRMYTDSLSLAALANGLILILQSDSTRREAAWKAKESIHAAGVQLLGAVLNKRTYPIPQKIYDRL